MNLAPIAVIGAVALLSVPIPGTQATPLAVAGAKSLSTGYGHVAALLGDGTLRMWGHDGWGQIGVGTSGFYQKNLSRGLSIQPPPIRCISEGASRARRTG